MTAIAVGAESRSRKHEAAIQSKIGSMIEELVSSPIDAMIKRILAWEIR